MSNVSRSIYQKLAEENKRLKADIWQMVMRPVTGETILLKGKWRDKFKRDQKLCQVLHECAVQYVKGNPNSIVAKIAKEFPPKEK